MPILNLTLRVFVSQDTYGIADITDLAGHTVAVEEGDIAELVLKREAPNATIVPVPSQEDAILLLSRGEVLAAFCNEQAAAYFAVKNQITNLKKIGEPIEAGPRAIAVREGNTQLLSAINEALDTVMRTEYDEIYQRWFGTDIYSEHQTAVTYRNVAFIVLGMGGIAAALFVWNRRLHSRVRRTTRRLSLMNDIFRHDLRNYVQSLLGSLELATLSGAVAESSRDILDIALESARGINELIEDLTFIESLDTTKIDVEAMSLESILSGAISMARASGILVDTRFPQELGEVHVTGCSLLPLALKRAIGYVARLGTRENDAQMRVTISATVATSTVNLYLFGGTGVLRNVTTLKDCVYQTPRRNATGLGIHVAALIVRMCGGTLKTCQTRDDSLCAPIIVCVTLPRA